MDATGLESSAESQRARLVAAEEALLQVGQELLARPGRRNRARRNQWLRLAVLSVGFHGPYWTLVMAQPPAVTLLALAAMMGLCAAGVLMQVAHPSLHIGLRWPVLVSQILVPTGLGKQWWKQKHNVVHHRSTNHVGHDDDLTVPNIFRVAPGQDRHPLQRLQPVLLPSLLPLLHLAMMLNAIRFALTGRVGNEQRITVSPLRSAGLIVAQFGTLPIFIGVLGHATTWPTAVVTSIVVTLTIGTVLALVFTVEHTVSEVTFNPDPSLGWHIRQLLVSADAAPSNRWITWYVGGLNHHIEHHLYPKASPEELPELRRHVRSICAAAAIEVTEFPTWRSAWAAHLRHLKAMAAPQRETPQLETPQLETPQLETSGRSPFTLPEPVR
jgi:linoleoyl-CoA desaturase